MRNMKYLLVFFTIAFLGDNLVACFRHFGIINCPAVGEETI